MQDAGFEFPRISLPGSSVNRRSRIRRHRRENRGVEAPALSSLEGSIFEKRPLVAARVRQVPVVAIFRIVYLDRGVWVVLEAVVW